MKEFIIYKQKGKEKEKGKERKRLKLREERDKLSVIKTKLVAQITLTLVLLWRYQNSKRNKLLVSSQIMKTVKEGGENKYSLCAGHLENAKDMLPRPFSLGES